MWDALCSGVESLNHGMDLSGHLRLLLTSTNAPDTLPRILTLSRVLTTAALLLILCLLVEQAFHSLRVKDKRNTNLEQRNRELAALQELVDLVTATLETQVVLSRVCRETVVTLSFQSALLCLIDKNSGTIRGAAGYGVPQSLVDETCRDLDGPDILADIVRTGRTEVITGWDERFHRETYERYTHADRVRIFAPIQDSQGTVGAVEVTVGVRPANPDQHQLNMLHSFLRHACTAIRNAQLHEKVLLDRERLNTLTQSLEEKNKQLESFVYMVSHDLKAPLVSIQGFLSLLDSECSGGLGEEGKFYLERVRGNTEHLQRLIQQLLELSRIGRPGERREWVDMEELTGEIAAAVGPRLQEAGITLEIVRPLPSLVGESTQLRRVMMNLVDNGIKYMGTSTRRQIRIEGRETTGGVEFIVTDTGPGIPEEMQKRVFQMFQRLPSAVGEGSGVGLATVQKIAEVHGGQAWVESGPAGQGSAFHVLFARLPGTESENSPAPERTQGTAESDIIVKGVMRAGTGEATSG